MPFIRDNGRKINLMVKGITFIKMEMNTKASSLRTCAMALVSGPLGQTKIHMKANGSTISSVDKAHTSMITVMSMLVISLMIFHMAKVR